MPRTPPSCAPDSPQARQAQRRIDEIQSLYRQWLRLLPALQAAQRQWRQASGLMRQLEDFYEQEYGPLNQAISAGLPVDLRTEGEYSVMSEDALYDAFGERQNLAWAWMRLAMKDLDRWGESEEQDAREAPDAAPPEG